MFKLVRPLLVLLLLLIVACSSVGQSGSLGPTASPLPAAPPPPLVLTFWHSWGGRSAQALDLLARRYEQQRPDVRIVLQSHPASSLVQDYSTSVADGSAPHMVLMLNRYLGDLAARSQILPLSDRIASENLENIAPSLIDAVTLGGQMQAVPLTYDALLLMYDRRKLPEPPTTLEQLLASTPVPADQVDANQSWGLAYYLSAATTLPYLHAFEGAIFDPAGRVVLDGKRRAGNIRWLEWLQTLRADPRVVATDDYGAVDAMIQSNRVTAVVDWSYRLASYQQLWGRDEVGLAALPRSEAAALAPPSILLADVICINPITTAQHRAAALDFLQFLISPPSQELLWSRGEKMPVNQRATVDGTAKEVAAFTSIAFPNTAANTRAWPVLDGMIRGVLAGSSTPDEALDAAAKGLRALQTSQ